MNCRIIVVSSQKKKNQNNHLYMEVDSYTYRVFSIIDDLKKITTKYYLEKYFRIDTQIKVVDFEF